MPSWPGARSLAGGESVPCGTRTVLPAILVASSAASPVLPGRAAHRRACSGANSTTSPIAVASPITIATGAVIEAATASPRCRGRGREARRWPTSTNEGSCAATTLITPSASDGCTSSAGSVSSPTVKPAARSCSRPAWRRARLGGAREQPADDAAVRRGEARADRERRAGAWPGSSRATRTRLPSPCSDAAAGHALLRPVDDQGADDDRDEDQHEDRVDDRSGRTGRC